MAVSRTACIDCCFLFRQLAKQFVRPRADADVGSVVVGFIFQMIPRVSRILSTILLRIGIFFCKRHNFQISQRGLFFTLLALPRPYGRSRCGACLNMEGKPPGAPIRNSCDWLANRGAMHCANAIPVWLL